MADTNLGQVVGIWLEPTEPPHKNVLWIKTINLLTSEKAGFIWNGIEWINIQGQGFEWKGIFDLQVDYKKQDVISYNNALYIKKNDNVNNIETPDSSSNFDLFLPAPTNGQNGSNGTNGQNGANGEGLPVGGAAGQVPIKNSSTNFDISWGSIDAAGAAGDVQIKGTNGKTTASSAFNFLTGLLSLAGNFIIKGLSATAGNALEVRNSANTSLLQVTNTGEVQVKGIYGITNNVNNRIVFETAGYNYRTQIGGLNGVEIYSGQSNTVGNLEALFTSARIVFYNPLIIDSVRTKLIDPTDPLQTQFTYDLILKGSDGALSGTSKSVFIQDGMPHTDATGTGYGGTGVKLQSWQKQPGTTPILRTVIEIKEGDKIAFYGATPIAKQSLPTNPTNAQLATVLSNLGLVNLITP